MTGDGTSGGGSDCETIHDCDLPTETYERVEDGETVVCPNCRREWEYNNGYFTQTGRKVDTGSDRDD